ncbi:unnamed protein product [Brugia pahangi]|uniref:Neur_chan_memb domain-containing protein n=1 Tax=Brugia pahangi TaxID=6280 RepID=A0A0N4TDJ9_BRUPA|nr:unnamed protein product [Brugia pahangi]
MMCLAASCSYGEKRPTISKINFAYGRLWYPKTILRGVLLISVLAIIPKPHSQQTLSNVLQLTHNYLIFFCENLSKGSIEFVPDK